MADITKIQPMGDSTQYELGARYLTTGRTISISDNDATNTGPASSAFNGTANLTVKLPSTIKASLTGNASTATKLATARTISLTGSVTGSGSFDGSGNLSIATTTNHTHSQYLTSHQSLSNYVTLNSTQTITGSKRFDLAVQCYRYTNNNALPAITMDKPGSYYIGIGADGTSNRIKFGPCSDLAGSSWVAEGTFNSNEFYFQGKITTTGDIMPAADKRVGGSGGSMYLGNSGNQGWILSQDICSHSGAGDGYWSARVSGVGHFKQLYGAVWNDYAEMRNVPIAQIDIQSIFDEKGEVERNYPYAGRCVREVGNGEMILTTERLQRGCKIISDTFGFCIGETENCKTPIAVSGRVLAYPYEDLNDFKTHIGYCVCSGPNGTVSIMTEEEEEKYPGRIIGTISEIPTYTIWYCGNKVTKPIQVDGRIWIYIK